MQSPLRSQGSGWVGVAGAAGLLVSVLILSGCPGTLDPNQFNMTSGTGGSGSGGSSSTGGSTGTGGSSGMCTGSNDGVAIVMTNCATSGCHDTSSAKFSGSLDLTVNSTIGSRLVGVMAAQPTAGNGAVCTSETTPYLMAGSNPASGLLIDKLKNPPPCGFQMPYAAPFPLNATQQTCLIQWATTLTSP